MSITKTTIKKYIREELAILEKERFEIEEKKLTKPQIKDRDSRAKEIMKNTKKEYGSKEGKDIAYAIATNQVKAKNKKKA